MEVVKNGVNASYFRFTSVVRDACGVFSEKFFHPREGYSDLTSAGGTVKQFT
jgi:hypothetical protein